MLSILLQTAAGSSPWCGTRRGNTVDFCSRTLFSYFNHYFFFFFFLRVLIHLSPICSQSLFIRSAMIEIAIRCGCLQNSPSNLLLRDSWILDFFPPFICCHLILKSKTYGPRYVLVVSCLFFPAPNQVYYAAGVFRSDLGLFSLLKDFK